MRHLGPFRAAVARDVDGAARSAAELTPRVHLDLPRAGEQDVRIFRIHRQAGAAGHRIGEERSRPRAAAVGRLVDAFLLLRPGESPFRADVDDVGVGGMNDDAADAARLVEAEVSPRRAGVDRLVDAVAHHVAVANRPGFAGAGPHGFGIGRGHGQGADGGYRLVVEDGREGRAAVGGLPHATGRGACVIDGRIARDPGGRRDAVADRRTHEAEGGTCRRRGGRRLLRREDGRARQSGRACRNKTNGSHDASLERSFYSGSGFGIWDLGFGSVLGFGAWDSGTRDPGSR